MRVFSHLLIGVLALCAVAARADLSATFNSVNDVAVTAAGFTASGTFSATLNFAPSVGAKLTVVKNTGVAFINGTFDNLAQGQVVTLTYAGVNYRFLANYQGGTGNDLVLQWAQTRAVAWGDNTYGQLGDRSTVYRRTPVDVYPTGVLASHPALAMAAGSGHTLAVCTDGLAAAWGSGNAGRLGELNTSGGSVVPTLVNATGVLAGKTVVQVAGGELHSVALCSDGTLVTWGRNDFGILGNQSTTTSEVPVLVTTTGALAGKKVVAVAAGDLFSMALCSDGTVVSWGYNGSGQLGDGTTTDRSAPVAVNTSGVLAGKTVVAISAGGVHGLALCSDGTLVAWGNGGSGQLGRNSTANSNFPVAVSNTGVLAGRTVVAIACGNSHNLALCSDGKVAAWGTNSHGELGNNSTTTSLVPVLVDSTGALAGREVVAIAAGYTHSMALCSDGTLAFWGYGFSIGSVSDALTPAICPPPTGGERYAAAFSGNQAFHSLALVAMPQLPVVGSPAVANITGAGATLSASVNPNGNITTALFEYGLTTNYGSTASVTLAPNDGLGAQTVSATLSGLNPGTIYHYRLTATNAFGTTTTTDGAFATATDVIASFASAETVPITAAQFSAGQVISVTLDFAPSVGATLMVVNNTGPAPIAGRFSNLAQGQLVTLSYGGVSYPFVANYFGGTGNDLVLQWAQTRTVAWGSADGGKLGANPLTNPLAPMEIAKSGALAGKTVISSAVGQNRSVAVCSDGTVLQWGNGVNVPTVMSPTGARVGRTVVAVSSGVDHVVALCADGAVVTWGSNVNGELGNNTRVASETPVLVNIGALGGQAASAVAAGREFSMALRADGVVVAWGAGYFGKLGNKSAVSSLAPLAVDTSGVLAGKTVAAITAGYDHSAAVTSDGVAVTWGKNDFGQLGNNSTSDSLEPVAVNAAGVLAGKTVISVSAGTTHSLALCSDGTVAAWGESATYGMLGNGGTTNSLIPVAVNTAGVLAGKKVANISAGKIHSVARCLDGTLVTWGGNLSGQLGINSTSPSSVPISISGNLLAAGETYAAAVTGGAAEHNLAQIASPLLPVTTSLAKTNLNSSGVTLNGMVNPNGSATSAVFEYGLTTSYGTAQSVTLSPNNDFNPQTVSVNLTGLPANVVYHYRLTATNLIGTSSTADATFAIATDVAASFSSAADVAFTVGSFSAEGGNFSATLNFPPPAGTNLMVVKNTGRSLITGEFNGLAQGQLITLTYGGVSYRFAANYFGGTGNDLVLQWANNRLAAWGANGAGQVDDTFGTRRIPVAVLTSYAGTDGALAGKTILSLSVGGGHNLVLCSDGSLVAWGNNSSAQSGMSGGGTSGIPRLVNKTGALVGKTLALVSAGSSHSLGLCTDGTLLAWGTGALGNGTSSSSSPPVAVNTSGVLAGKQVVALAAGSAHSLVLCADGTLAAWGSNTYGQLGDNSTSTSLVPVAVNTTGVLAGKQVIAISAGANHNVALCSDGTSAAWGRNVSGQLGNNSTVSSSVAVAVDATGVLAGKSVTAIAAGTEHTVALCGDGSMAAWGSNSAGQLGNNSSSNSLVPVAVDAAGVLAGKTVVSVSAGQTHSLARCADGTLAAWGGNVYGQLGNNSSINSPAPVSVNRSLLAVGENYAEVLSENSASHNVALIVSPPAPAVAGLAATNVTPSWATLNATVNPVGGSASVFFDFGLTNSYGSSIAGTPLIVTGNTEAAIAANVADLEPNTTYHYRISATNAGGASKGGDLTFTTPANVNPPTGGTMQISPSANVVVPRAELTVTFANWADSSEPLSYVIFVDGAVSSPMGVSAARVISAPAATGAHTLRARIVDALGNFAELTQTLTVDATQEGWRSFYFGSPLNEGDGADSADPDADGNSNLFEFVAGLHPANNASRFTVRVTAVPNQPGQMKITFGPVIPGRTYTVKYAGSLAYPSWNSLWNFSSSDNGSERTITDFSAGTGPRFYRVDVSIP